METTTIEIDQGLDQRLQQVCTETGRPKSRIIEEALERFLSHEEWLASSIREGVDAADRGDFASPEVVKAAFAKWGVAIED